MSSLKTEHYQLHKWEPGDDFIRTEFNENFESLDGVLDALPKLRWGQYVGEQATSNTTAQKVVLGQRPRMILLMPNEGNIYTSGGSWGCMLVDGGDPGRATLTFADDGFTVWNYANAHSYLNASGTVYSYLVIC